MLRNGQATPAVPYVYGATLAGFKAAVDAATASSATTPTQGVMQNAATAPGMASFRMPPRLPMSPPPRPDGHLGAAGVVVDGAATNGYPGIPRPSASMQLPTLYGPENLAIHHPTME
ncbi:MAG: hypothetical protein IPI84_12650 [Holophagaceae bacterium]|nr:hypothetical protein [Holophagaceae bacterium]